MRRRCRVVAGANRRRGAHAGPAGLHARESRLDHDRRLVRGVVALQELTIATEVQRAYLGSGQTDQIAFMATFP
jgi:hypothetical protein